MQMSAKSYTSTFNLSFSRMSKLPMAYVQRRLERRLGVPATVQTRSSFLSAAFRRQIVLTTRDRPADQGMTMQEVVDLLSDAYGWSDSVSNLSNKLQRESLRYKEAVQLADALGYEII